MIQPIPPIRTTVVGSYPFPAWLELATKNLAEFGKSDLEELIDDAVQVAVQDQLQADLDVISDGEQTRLDFNLSFYGFLEGIEHEAVPVRRWGPAAHDQRGKHKVIGDIKAKTGLGAVREYQRLVKLAAHTGKVLKCSIPGPYTLSGRLDPNGIYEDRYEVTEALIPIVSHELEALVKAGCREITVDEPSMSCYAYKEDPERFVDIFNRTVAAIKGKCFLSTHLCFGNFKGRPVGKRTLQPMLPAFLELDIHEVHIEMANREFAEIELLAKFAKRMRVAAGIIDVKNYYIETVEDVVDRIRQVLKYVDPENLSVAPDCGLSQTARWASRQKLQNMVLGAKKVRQSLGLSS